MMSEELQREKNYLKRALDDFYFQVWREEKKYGNIWTDGRKKKNEIRNRWAENIFKAISQLKESDE